MDYPVGHPACPVRRALTLLGSRWKVLLIKHLSEGTLRYGELRRRIPDISEKMLINELKELVAFKLVAKQAFPEVPPRVEYSLTERGRQALPVVASIITFGLQNLADEPSITGAEN